MLSFDLVITSNSMPTNLVLKSNFAIRVSQTEANAMAVSLRSPEDLHVRLDRLAKWTGRVKAYYMIEEIREQIGDLEDLYRAEKITERNQGRTLKTHATGRCDVEPCHGELFSWA